MLAASKYMQVKSEVFVWEVSEDIKEFLEFIFKLMQRTNQVQIQLKKITEFSQATF